VKVARRMKFAGHFDHCHDDLRPDLHLGKEALHTALYGWVAYSRSTFWGTTTAQLLISYEVLAQLCTPDIMRLNRTEEVVNASISGAVGRISSVNVNRFLTVGGQNVLSNTALVASAKFVDMMTQVRKLDFGLSLVASQ